MYTLHPLDPDDWTTLRRLRVAALSDAPTAFGSTLARESAFTDEEWAARARQWTDPARGCVFVAWSDGASVGIAAGFVDQDDPALGHLVSMWVAPEARGTGAARALVDAVVAWARGFGLRAMTLAVTVGNGPAERLYGKAGFLATGHVFPHPNYPELKMRDLRKTL